MKRTDSWPTLGLFLQAQTFIVLTHNPANTPDSRYEAWAYNGLLDFDLASPVRFGIGPDPANAMAALDSQLADRGPAVTSPPPDTTPAVCPHIDRRELATILAALRFHQDENLQGGDIADAVVADIASDGGTLAPLSFEEVGRLCQRLNTDSDPAAGLHIQPPHRDGGEKPLFRVVYVIDVNATDPREAAEYVHQIMADPNSMAPLLHVLDHTGHVQAVDLSGT